MSSVTHIQQIVAVIRQEMAARVNSNGLTPPRTSFKSDLAQRKLVSKRNKDSLPVLIGKRIQSIDRSDPDRGRKAFRIFLESVLLTEFGEELINDPAFYRMVDEIQQQMAVHPEMAGSIDDAITRLLGGVDNS